MPAATQIFEGETTKKQSAKSVRKYSWDEVSKHKGRDDLWIVIRGKVYDVTSWVPNHPGGNLILNGGGRESTALFMSYHPLRVEQLLHKYEIGEVDDYRPFYNWDSDFYTTVKRRVESCINEHGLNKSSRLMYFKSLLIICGWIISFYFGMVKGYYIAALAMGFCHSHFGITIGHDGNHGAFSRSFVFNRLAAHAMDLMGGSSIVWMHQHNIGHHPNSNRQGDSCKSECDQDDPDTKSGFPLVRVASALPHRWYHAYQHIYFWLLICFVSTKWYINDVKAFIRKKYVNIDFFEIQAYDIFLLTCTKLLYATYAFFTPFYYHPLPQAIALWFLFSAATSYMFVCMFAVNHLTEDASFPNEATACRDWAKLQCMTATNFCVGSEFWTWMSGGLNYQLEHHLFPYVAHVHLPKISPIVQQTCREFDVPYVAFRAYSDALYSHYSHLKYLGNPDLKKQKTY